jgi:hypothetical protein
VQRVQLDVAPAEVDEVTLRVVEEDLVRRGGSGRGEANS